MMLNEGMVAGTCGWALKPKGYRSTMVRGTVQNVVHPKRQHLSLRIRLLAAQRLPVPADKDNSHAPKLKPYVKAQLHIDSPHSPGHSRDTNLNGDSKDDLQAQGGEEKDTGIYKRRSATCRTDCPNFDGEVMSWLNMSDVIQELSFIRYVHVL